MTGDGDIITLKDAAQHFGFSVYALRAEADNGRLVIALCSAGRARMEEPPREVSIVPKPLSAAKGDE